MDFCYCCHICDEAHYYSLIEVIDVVSQPELKDALQQGNLPSSRCRTCGTPTGLEKRTYFVYWADDWVGLVIPSLPGTLVERTIKWAGFLLSHNKPDRVGLPNTLQVFGSLRALQAVI